MGTRRDPGGSLGDKEEHLGGHRVGTGRDAGGSLGVKEEHLGGYWVGMRKDTGEDNSRTRRSTWREHWVGTKTDTWGVMEETRRSTWGQTRRDKAGTLGATSGNVEGHLGGCWRLSRDFWGDTRRDIGRNIRG